MVLISLCSLIDARSQNTVPCLIFSGKSENNRLFDISKLNRITYNDANNDGLSISGENFLAYISSDKTLTITSPSSKIFNIGIFNINGVLIATSEMTAGQ